jgi:hypothetical protein
MIVRKGERGRREVTTGSSMKERGRKKGWRFGFGYGRGD